MFIPETHNSTIVREGAWRIFWHAPRTCLFQITSLLLIAKIFSYCPAFMAILQVFGARRHQPVNFATRNW